MRLKVTILGTMVACMTAVQSYAELKEITVGGSIRIRGSAFIFENDNGARYGAEQFKFGPLDDFDTDGDGIVDNYESQDDSFFFEQRTTVNVSASFTDNIEAFVELDSYGLWGEDFRGFGSTVDSDSEVAGTFDVISANDRYSATDVGLYQGYIKVDEVWGAPITLTIGRQELQFGNEWLVGNNDTGKFFRGLSFDAIRFDYAQGPFTLAVWASRLFESDSVAQSLQLIGDGEDENVDFYGIYATVDAGEHVTFDAYYLHLRRENQGVIGRRVAAFPAAPPTAGNLADFGNRGYFEPLDAVELHTVGLRISGDVSNFYFDFEGAYQFGDARKGLASIITLPGLSVQPNFYEPIEFDNYGGTLNLSYVFASSALAPSIFFTGAYLGGGETVNGKTTASFHRLFSDTKYSELLTNSDLSNSLVGTVGMTIQPSDKVGLSAQYNYLRALESPSDSYLATLGLPADPDQDLGHEVVGIVDYDYSEDLHVQFGGAMFIEGKGLSNTLNYVAENGTQVFGRLSENEDQRINWYFWFETGLRF